MTETPAQFLRRAAEHLRGLAQAAIDAGWSGRTRIEHAGATDVPILVSADTTHIRGVADVMNDAYANLLATLGNPTVGLLLAEQWDGIAERHATCTIGKFAPTLCHDLEAAVNAARVLLGETEN